MKDLNEMRPGVGVKDFSNTKGMGRTVGQVFDNHVSPAIKVVTYMGIFLFAGIQLWSLVKGNGNGAGEAVRKQINNGSFRNHGRR